ncbi:MAG: thioredoxin domain-containing protein [Nitrospinota bacterium]|nr:thioredoxin domain-containing protein [Nitrospinota bacterium]
MTKSIRLCVFTVFSLLFFIPRAHAGDFFKWVDEKGETHYSDNKAEAAKHTKNLEEKSFSDIELNIVQQAEWPPSMFPEESADNATPPKKKTSSKNRPSDLPWFTEDSFDYDVLRSGQLTLVEFWATWCGICRKVDPVINSLAREYGSRVKFGRVDIDEEKSLQRTYKVKGVPNLVIFKNGKMIGRMVGGYSRDSYVKMIEKHM